MHEIYVQCFSGHVVSNRHLGRLGRAVRTFLTPGQTLRCVEMIFETISNNWQAFYDVSKGIGDIKEIAMIVDSGSGFKGPKALAVSLSLQVYLILFILSNLPMQHLTEESAKSVCCLVSDFREQTVRKALLKILRVKRLLPRRGKKRRESVMATDGWEMQIVATAMLRVEYTLSITQITTTQESMVKVIEQAKEVIISNGGNGQLIAELELEIVSHDFEVNQYCILLTSSLAVQDSVTPPVPDRCPTRRFVSDSRYCSLVSQQRLQTHRHDVVWSALPLE